MTEVTRPVWPVEIVREVVRGPGLWLVEGRDPSGVPCALQLIPVVAVADDELRWVDEVARAAEAETELTIFGQGTFWTSRRDALDSKVVDADLDTPPEAESTEWGDKTRPDPAVGSMVDPDTVPTESKEAVSATLMLYWILPLAAAAPPLEALPPAGLARVSVALANVLAIRHGRGQPHGLLSAPLVRVDGANVSIAGVPLVVPMDDLADGASPAPLAPEERGAGVATVAGDLWRFGMVLRGLTDGRALPVALEKLVDELTAATPERRPASIAEVQQRLADAWAAAEGAQVATSEVSALGGRSILDSPDGSEIDAGDDDLPEVDPSLVTPIEAPLEPAATAPPPVKYEGPMVRAQGGEAVLPADGAASRAEIAAARVAELVTPTAPSVDSPWAEVGTHKIRAIPTRSPAKVVPPTLVLPRASRSRPSAAAIRRRGAPDGWRGWSPRWLIAMLIAVLLSVFGAVALLVRIASPTSIHKPAIIGTSDMVMLSSSPPAEVIAEADGRRIGRTPLRIMVPGGADIAVLLSAPERQPIRIVLPDRGALQVELSPLPPEACEVHVQTPSGAMLEEYGGTQTVPGVVAVFGAAIFVRPGASAAVGARLVRCPADVELGPADERTFVRNEPIELRLAAVQTRRARLFTPPGVTVFYDNRALEGRPASFRTETAFAPLRLQSADDTTDLWVALAPRTDIFWRPSSARAAGSAAPSDAEPVGSSTLELASATRAEPEVASDAVNESPPALVPMLSKAPPRRPKSPKIRRRAAKYFRRGRRALAAGRLRSARTALRWCIKVDESFPECHRDLGSVYRRLRQKKLGNEHLQRYLALRPKANDAARIRRLLRR